MLRCLNLKATKTTKLKRNLLLKLEKKNHIKNKYS
jgi:hypothetical protein